MHICLESAVILLVADTGPERQWSQRSFTTPQKQAEIVAMEPETSNLELFYMFI